MNRSGFDRRLDEDRRGVYNLNYFEKGGTERRHIAERRSSAEKRAGWQRVSQWSSVPVGEYKQDMQLVDPESATDIPTYRLS